MSTATDFDDRDPVHQFLSGGVCNRPVSPELRAAIDKAEIDQRNKDKQEKEDKMSKYEALKKADNDSWATVVRCGYSREKEDSAIIKYESAHHTLREYKRKAAEMHEELVEALEEMMEWCAEYWDKDSIQELIERAKAL